ncbi:MAG: hypothetical protein GX611_02985 [Clostridiales bacterium]|nr:hypothetical protein [Clostridiales bacterium]
MKKRFVSLLAALLLLSLLTSAQASVGRDILLVSRQYSNWTRQDEVIILDAEGNRLLFDISSLPQEIRNDPVELLFFLRSHALSDSTMLHNAPAPLPMPPAGQETADRIRVLLSEIKDPSFESQLYAFDAGTTLLYGVRILEGELAMTLLAEGGSFVGQSQDPAALEIFDLTAAFLMME